MRPLSDSTDPTDSSDGTSRHTGNQRPETGLPGPLDVAWVVWREEPD